MTVVTTRQGDDVGRAPGAEHATISKREGETDVLIVGAGPVGLFLANECVRRGLRFRLVEAHATQSMHSKALAIFPRTLEILDMAGLVGPFLEVANRVTSVGVISHHRTLALVPFTPRESPYQFIAMVPQDVSEGLLAEQLRARGGQIEYETSLVTAAQTDASVTATLEHRGRRFEVRAKFVVGCDGAHSTVRHLLQLPFAGAEYDSSFMLADVETNDALPSDQLQLCPSEFGPVAIFPMSSTRRRIVATIDHADGEAPTLEIVRRILRERAPVGIEARALHWSSYFRIHRRHAAQLRVGRIFIAGDAAHIHSPFGGQGMNTGLHDVWNLAWKLALVLRGHAGDTLLDSYGAERLPVIEHVIEMTDTLTKVMGTSSHVVQYLRDALIPLISGLAPFQHAFVERLSELGVAYRGSAIVDGDGRRYFDDSLRGGNGIRDRFLLLCDAAADASVREAARELARSRPETVELRLVPHRGIRLVRPDGYVAYSADHQVSAALREIRSLLDRQTRAPAAALDA
jgi:2-polyprenyl-6-methoxyphenol hydroxylase-like FAD-dependent oxidoreductase